MKTLLLVILVASAAQADQSGEAFATGFLRALQQAQQGQQLSDTTEAYKSPYQGDPNKKFDYCLYTNGGYNSGCYTTLQACEQMKSNHPYSVCEPIAK